MGSSGEKEWSSGFGFNDVDFSDRVLRLEIAPLLPCNKSDDSNTSEIGATTGLKVKKIHVNSLVLSSRSHFFYKLFKNGMRETQQRDEVALKINESEEAALMDLLKFIYGNPMSATSAQDLVDVLMASDKFDVPSSVRYCVDLLLKLPMSTELALLCIELPSSVLADGAVHKLIKAAKKFFVSHYRSFKTFKKEGMGLPLSAVELVIESDDLKVFSEDRVFDFVLEWGRLRYPELEERREILTRLLLNFVCLPKMSSLKLKKVINYSDFDSEKVYKPVLDALFCKDPDVATGTAIYEYPKRVYEQSIAIQVVKLQMNRPHCLIYFHFTKKQCADLVPDELRYSQDIFLGGQIFLFFAVRSLENQSISLYVVVRSENCNLGFNVLAMKKSSGEFTSLVKEDDIVLPRNGLHGFDDLFKMSWAEFMSDENEYFIDGVLHLRADLTLLS